MLVASRALVVGAALDAGAIEVAERPVTPGEGISEPPGGIGGALAGASAGRALAPGQILHEVDVRRPALVPRGAPVRVVVRRGAVTVTAAATLERAARPSERTTARLTELGRVVAGRLVNGTTLLEEEGTP